MKTTHVKKRILSLLLALVMLFSLCPQAFAADSVARDSAGNVYTSVSAAWNAAKSGKVITMTADWKLSDRLVLNEGESATIDMNGLRIDRQRSSYTSDGEVIYLDEGASLTLKSTVTTTTHTFTGWEDGSRKSLQVTSGGLVTGGWSSNGAGGIHMKKSAMLTLDNVAVAGNCAEIVLWSDGYGGGVMMDGENCTLVMKNGAQIAYNEAQDEGGGVYVNGENGAIEMTGSSSIHHNRARDGGGGVYFCDSTFCLRSSDGTASISNNKVTGGNGGAVFTEQCPSSTNMGLISGITMNSNSASNWGGAVYLNQECTTISGCTFKDNTAKEGGAIYDNNDDNVLSGCTIENNTASSEGGGVYVSAVVDITLSGTLFIKGNTRTNSTIKDDLFLNQTPSATAYVSGSPTAKSEIGIRTAEDTPSRSINDSDKNKRSFFYEQAFFSDFDGYYIEFNTDSGLLKAVQGEKETVTPTEITNGAPTQISTYYNDQPVYTGYFRYASVTDTTIDLTSKFYYSDGYFLNGENGKNNDPTVYNSHLATMSMAMAMAGFNSNIGLNNEIKNQNTYDLDYTYKSQNIEKLLSDIGVESEDIYISDTYAVKPGTGTIGVSIGKKAIGNDYVLVPIVVRSAGYENEWASNVTLNDNSNNTYYKGEAAGFANAADQVFMQVQAYIDNYNLKSEVANGKVKFWIMGYSRGGATANLTAKRLVEAYCDGTNDRNNQVYAYCFEAPQGGWNDAMTLSAEKYYCIHNCINKVDAVPEVGPDEMGFIRYGVDHYVPGEAEASNVQVNDYQWDFAGYLENYKTWYDNSSWPVGSNEYTTQREKMCAQLTSVDPNLSFYDYFAIAEQDIVKPKTKPLSYDGTPITQEQYIHILIRALQAWGLYHIDANAFRYSYSQAYTSNNTSYISMQSALQVVVPIIFGKSASEQEGLMSCISNGASALIGGVSGKVRGLWIWDDVIGDWLTLSQSDRNSYLDWLWSYLMETEYPFAEGGTKCALDYLTKDDIKALRSAWNTLVDIMLRFIAVDYNTDIPKWNDVVPTGSQKAADITEGYTGNQKAYGNHSLVVLGTLLYNMTALAQGHYPEINYAWLRSYDSFYDEDQKQPFTLETAAAPNVTISVKGSTMTLESTTNGAAIFYRLSKDGGTSYGDWMPYHKAVTLPEGSIKVQYTAIYCGSYSAVETKDAGYVTPETTDGHTVTVNGKVVSSYKADENVTVDGTGTGEQVFKCWVVNEGSNIVTSENTANAILTFIMPSDDVVLTAEYVTRTKDVTLTVAKPVAGQNLPTTGMLSWTVGGETKSKTDVPVYWLEQVNDGTQLASGTAKYGTKYSVAALVEQDLNSDLAFSFDLEEEGTSKVQYGDATSENAYAAYTNAAGALRIFGGQVETDKLTLTENPTATITLAANATEADLKAALPASVTITLNNTPTVFALDVGNAVMTGAWKDGTVKDDGTVTIPIVGTENSLTVQVTVQSDSEIEIEAPTAEAEETQSNEPAAANLLSAAPAMLRTASVGPVSNVQTFKDVTSVTVTLSSSTDGATIKYRLGDGDATEYTGPIPLTGEAGKKTTFVLTAWAEMGNSRSSDVTYTYILDNPYTVTINCKDTGMAGLLPDTKAWTKTVTFSYYSGEKVTIAAPAEADELFEKWDSIPDGVTTGNVSDTALTVNSISSDITLTAIYNPVINTIDLTLDTPTTGSALSEKLKRASVKVTNSYEMTDYFKKVEWTPTSETATEGTVYTAKLTLDFAAIQAAAKAQNVTVSSDNLKYILSEDLTINVNDGNKGIKSSVSKTNDAIYLTFPATTSQTSATGELASVGTLNAVAVSYDDAQNGDWNLPATATLHLANGKTTSSTIVWTTPILDETQLEYIATGMVNLPEGVTNDNGVPLTVSVNIVVLKEDNAIAAPTSSVASGTYTKAQYVRLYSLTSGAAVYYTLDGTNPTKNSALYEENTTIKISSTATLKAIAVKSSTQSAVATYTYTINHGGSGSGSSAYAVTVKDAKNGAVTADRKTASSGATVTLTVKPDQGWTLETLTATNASGKEVELTIVKLGETYTFKMPSSSVTVNATFMEDNTILNYFVDVPTNSYYYNAVLWAVEQGITQGTDNSHFSPDGICTRAQAVTFLWRAAGSPAPKTTTMSFTDVPAGSYYYDAVLWAVENGITKGTTDTTFSPNMNCSRAQIVTFLWRSEKSPAAGTVNPFTDVKSDIYYADAVLWAVKENVTKGTTSTTFSPDANCTRAQIVTFIWRCMK